VQAPTARRRTRAILAYARTWLTRDVLLRTVGVLGLAHEVLVQELERPTVLLIFAGLAGLTDFLPGRKARP
jgi:hypothetical protein